MSSARARKDRLTIGMALFFWASAVGTASSAPLSPPPEIAKCQACHGSDGNSTSAEVPRLNGQSPRYLASRIRSFADPTRQNFNAIHNMWDVNSQLSTDAVLAVAAFFSAQPPTALSSSGTLAEQGRSLYESGNGAQLPACQGCHGEKGEGRGSVPRLGGQHALYLHSQMASFSLNARVNETMNPHARTITQEQIMALSAYLGRD